MKGYFGIGVAGVSKAMNVGAVFRTAHAFGASFVFSVAASYRRGELAGSDTSDTPGSVPTYHFATAAELALPQGCRLVGVEITPDAIELPSFRHPRQAAYLIGSEREGLSAELQDLCDYVVRIPTRFSVNLAVAGALVMYDRTLSMGRFAERPVGEGGAAAPRIVPAFGEPLYKKRARQRAARAASPKR